MKKAGKKIKKRMGDWKDAKTMQEGTDLEEIMQRN